MAGTRFYTKTASWIVKHVRGEVGGGRQIYTKFANKDKWAQNQFLSLVVDKLFEYSFCEAHALPRSNSDFLVGLRQAFSRNSSVVKREALQQAHHTTTSFIQRATWLVNRGDSKPDINFAHTSQHHTLYIRLLLLYLQELTNSTFC